MVNVYCRDILFSVIFYATGIDSPDDSLLPKPHSVTFIHNFRFFFFICFSFFQGGYLLLLLSLVLFQHLCSCYFSINFKFEVLIFFFLLLLSDFNSSAVSIYFFHYTFKKIIVNKLEWCMGGTLQSYGVPKYVPFFFFTKKGKKKDDKHLIKGRLVWKTRESPSFLYQSTKEQHFECLDIVFSRILFLFLSYQIS